MIFINIQINNFFEEINNSLYISSSEISNLKLKYNTIFLKINKNIFLKIKYYKFYKFYKKIEKNINKLNSIKVLNKVKTNSNLLDDINGYKLDMEQKTAVYTDEDNNLVVAGAGSGKTLTIVGKIRYLIEEKNINEKDILCISFTNASVLSLKESLKKQYNYNIDVYTFHKLSLSILQNQNYLIASSDLLEYIIDEIFNSYIYNNELINDQKLYYSLKKNIITFIHLFKSSGYKIDKFDDFFNYLEKEKNKEIKKQNIRMLKIIKCFYILYQKELNSQNKIDFDDMIVLATNYVKKNGIYRNYKYIIIDEYQDTSYIRYRLIKQIKDVTNAKIFAVGDDFQSIYRFSGCDLNIFLRFSKYYGKTRILKIQNTYRNSKELIDVAGNFIMKNKKQLKKKLNSSKHLNKPIKIIYYNNIKKDVIKLIEFINKKYSSKILILGRNNFDINMIKSDDLNFDNISYLTVHKSKGLEEDNVIVINMLDNKYGFPNKMINDDIIRLVLNEQNCYPYEEERRLFYVALTRTKNNVYLLTDKNHESTFIKELKNNYKNHVEIININ